jgi:hypothetical protein
MLSRIPDRVIPKQRHQATLCKHSAYSGSFGSSENDFTCCWFGVGFNAKVGHENAHRQQCHGAQRAFSKTRKDQKVPKNTEKMKSTPFLGGLQMHQVVGQEQDGWAV